MTYYTIYKTTNLLNGMIYIGCHSTDNLNDSYIGSGTEIYKDIRKYGKGNFKKEILFVYDTEKEMLDKERELVNEHFILRSDTYNILKGGGGFSAKDCVAVKDKYGNNMLVNKNDARYLSGELKAISKGLVVAIDKNGNKHHISVDDPRYISGEFIHMSKNTVKVRNKLGQTYRISVDLLDDSVEICSKYKKHLQIKRPIE